MASSLTSGTRVWISDKKRVWARAEIVGASARFLQVRVDHTGKTLALPAVGAKFLHLVNGPIGTAPSDGAVSGAVDDDLTALSHLHEPGILDALRRRFEASKVYTNVGEPVQIPQSLVQLEWQRIYVIDRSCMGSRVARQARDCS